jgi:5'-nucleotidase
MRILISNDDGILAPGLAALRAAVADMGEITVVAPDSAQSAAGHGITLKRPLVVQRVHLGGEAPFEGLSVDGQPADCVRLAMYRLLDRFPELVLSGINAGPNVGINVLYSGTVAAAAEGAMCGIPAVAFSAHIADQADFPHIARLCRWVLDQLLDQGLRAGELINVNIPDLGPERPRGVRVRRQSTAEIEEDYRLHHDVDGREAYLLAEGFRFGPARKDTDIEALAQGYITITPLHVDMTNHRRLEDLAGRSWEWPPSWE